VSARLTGSCLCGQMRFTTPGPLRPVIACHCSQCRKSSGHFVAATSAARDKVAITGEVTWYQSFERARRGFFATCGSQMFWDGLGDNLSIFAGCFDGATGEKTLATSFVPIRGTIMRSPMVWLRRMRMILPSPRNFTAKQG